jgi:sporulation protein YlmC with PRC-barrel domain
MADNNDKNRNLYYLDELSGYKVASDYPDVRGWEIQDSRGETIGKVDGLLVNKEAERVVYLDVEVDEDVLEEGHEPLERKAGEGIHEFVNKDGEDHLIVPVGMVALDDDNNVVKCDRLSKDTFKKTRRHPKGEGMTRHYEVMVLQTYLPDSDGNMQSTDGGSFYNRDEFRPRNR